MNLIIDGVDKGEAISLIEEVKEGFDPEKVQVVSEPRSNKVGSAGFYSRHVVRGLDLPHVYLWEGSWISRIVEQKMVGATPSEFEYEFLNHRLNLNRGDHFVLLPDTRLHYYSLFPQEELEDGYVPQHILEKRYDLFQDYATKWGYETLHTDFSDEAFQQNVLISRRAAVYNQHPFHSTDYVGPEKPVATFVGDSNQGFGFQHRPFHSVDMSRYFEPFGRTAIFEFGYCSVQGFQNIHGTKWEKTLLKRPIMVGAKARNISNVFPHVEIDFGHRTDAKVELFGREARETLSLMGLAI
jgi:hypothetical protein